MSMVTVKHCKNLLAQTWLSNAKFSVEQNEGCSLYSRCRLILYRRHRSAVRSGAPIVVPDCCGETCINMNILRIFLQGSSCVMTAISQSWQWRNIAGDFSFKSHETIEERLKLFGCFRSFWELNLRKISKHGKEITLPWRPTILLTLDDTKGQVHFLISCWFN